MLRYLPKSPFNENIETPFSFWEQFDINMRRGRPNLLVITGASQTGKTSLGKWVCQHYKPFYTLWYKVEDIFETMELNQTLWDLGNRDMLRQWYLFDEPQGEAPKANWADERNKTINMVLSMWGFMKPNIIMCLPSIDDITPNYYRNLTYVVTMSMHTSKETGEDYRLADVWRPWRPIWASKWKWINIGNFIVPPIHFEEWEMRKKTDNFFNDKMKRAKKDLEIQEKIRNRILNPDRHFYNPIKSLTTPHTHDEW